MKDERWENPSPIGLPPPEVSQFARKSVARYIVNEVPVDHAASETAEGAHTQATNASNHEAHTGLSSCMAATEIAAADTAGDTEPEDEG